uniref:Uncharacterized protein n=1 Tax=Oryza sativa subsp. japonica TaxID=39947 RepID=Q7EY52_ORYSJ|nr:hypothetical protein [Oryza sativa Japonica Group]BAD31671.1 hypothetical protein [Oryza sativa Japonica Group]
MTSRHPDNGLYISLTLGSSISTPLFREQRRDNIPSCPGKEGNSDYSYHPGATSMLTVVID